MLLQIEEKRIDPDITLIELKGRLALGRESQRLEGMADELVNSGQLRVILDLTEVSYIDSAGIGILALFSAKFREAVGKFAVVAAEGRVRQMLKMTQMDRIVPLTATIAEALSAFGETLPPAAA